MEGEYEWVREYLYDVRQDEEKRTYILRETPTYMAYVDLNTRLMVHKRGKRMKSDSVMAQEFPRPSQVCAGSMNLSGHPCLAVTQDFCWRVTTQQRQHMLPNTRKGLLHFHFFRGLVAGYILRC